MWTQLRVYNSSKILFSTIRSESAKLSTSCGEKGVPVKATKKKKGTPKGKLDDYDAAAPSYSEKEPLKKHPNNINPTTGEANGPSGPEPTRYINITNLLVNDFIKDKFLTKGMVTGSVKEESVIFKLKKTKLIVIVI